MSGDRTRSLVKPRPPGTLKAAQAALITAAGGTIGAADKLDKSQTQVQRYSDAGESGVHMTVADARALTVATGDRVLLEFLALEAGCALLPLEVEAEGDMGQGFAGFGEKASHLFSTYAKALADDGMIDAAEAGQLISDADQVMAAIARIRADLETRRGEDGA